MDNTLYLQKLISSGSGVVRIPDGDYEVTSPLEVSDDTHIICSPRTHIRLANNANCPILINKDKGKGVVSRNITIEGGIWDGNNVHQQRENYRHYMYHFGQLICFSFCEHLTLKGLTVKDPQSFGIMLTDVKYFTVSDIFFDFNCKTLNEDGVHINGWAKYGHITNLKGITNDDLVAINSDEGYEYSAEDNDISDITVDGIYGGEDGWTAVRLLSRHAHVRNIAIRNVYGAYKFNIVSFTHWDRAYSPDIGNFDNILIENIFATCVRNEGCGHGGLIWFQPGLAHIGKIVIQNVLRTESSEKQNTSHTVDVGENTNIESLTISNVMQDVPVEKSLIMISPEAQIGTLIVDGKLREPSEFILP